MSKVLVVEDNENTRKVLKSILETIDGIKVEVASDGIQGIEKVDATSPDLVILDLMMPNQDGWETYKQMEAKHKDIPVIFATALSKKDGQVQKVFDNLIKGREQTSVEVTNDNYIQKPFDNDELIQKVKHILKI